MMKHNLVAGIDIGGTGIRMVLMQAENRIASATLTTASFAGLTDKQCVERLAHHLLQILPSGASLSAVGIGASGPVNVDSGIIDNPYTLPDFSGFSLTTLLSAHLQLPVKIDNDATSAALGEYHFGAGQGAGRMMMVTLGTGVGVALLDNGAPFRLANGQHPEAGHIPISDDPCQCYCGLQGCWETLAARSWLQRQLEKWLPQVPYHLQGLAEWQKFAQQFSEVSDIFYRYGQHVGRGLGALLMAYGPDCTILSGSAAALYPLYRSGVESMLIRAKGFELSSNILTSRLGDNAGAMGATRLCDEVFAR